jgi:hypothetical protein
VSIKRAAGTLEQTLPAPRLIAGTAAEVGEKASGPRFDFLQAFFQLLSYVGVNLPAHRKLFASFNVSRSDKTKVAKTFRGMSHNLHLHVRIAAPSDISQVGAFLAGIDINREMRREEYEGFGVLEKIPSIGRIQIVLLPEADYAFQFTDEGGLRHRGFNSDELPLRVKSMCCNGMIHFGLHRNLGCLEALNGLLDTLKNLPRLEAAGGFGKGITVVEPEGDVVCKVDIGKDV